jgi:hypothetical protein
MRWSKPFFVGLYCRHATAQGVAHLQPKEGNGRLVQTPLIVRDSLLTNMKASQSVDLLQMICRFEEVFIGIQRNRVAAKWAGAAFVARYAGFHLHGPTVYRPLL